MEPRKSFLASQFSSLLIFFLVITISLCEGKESSEEHSVKPHKGPVVERDERRTLFDTEYGEISAIDVKDGNKTLPYHLQFFTLEPNSVFLPVLLHAAMVFYVHTGSGKLSWANEDETGTTEICEGDVGSLREGSVFYIHSNLEAQRKKLRIYAMFTNTDDSTFDPSIGAYSRINELVKGFDKKIIQAAFKVPEDLVEAITNKKETPAIVHAPSKRKHNSVLELEPSFLKYFIGIESNSKKLQTYNIFDNDPDFKNSHGWTLTVTKKQLKPLKQHNIGFLMVNLTMESMLGPHWNPLATEIAVVLEGEGMVRVVCGSNNVDECQNKRFRVKQGDVFLVPRFHPMAHMSFDKEPLVFMGFSTAAKKNHPQFLAGKGSVLQILDKQIVATSLCVSKRTIDQLLDSPDDSIIFGCNSCAEEEEKLMEEEKEKEKEEEEKRKREEEEEEEKGREKEEAKKREEEEKERERRRKEEEEEEVRRREEERKREEEEAKRQQEERERKREEKEARRREEARRKQEEIRRQKEREREEKKAEKGKERRTEEAESEEEAARRQQEKRERKREEREQEEESEGEGEAKTEEEEEETESEGGRRQRRRSREEETTEWEEEVAKRQQEERERRREHGSDNKSMKGKSNESSFDGRRVLKIPRNV
ncbi:vicilin-like seed storage protein At4g36700 [Cicer arietinum]